jgi:glycosyltransferase involved in cell wall biosynthesis
VKVSVFMPTRNRPDKVQDAIRSVLAQSHQDLELVINNVGCPILVPDDPRIRLVENECRGPAADFQAALDLCTGEIVTPLADDDTLPPHALATAAGLIGDHRWLIGRTVINTPDGDPVCLRGGTIEDIEDTMRGSYMLGGAVYWKWDFDVGGFNTDFDGAADFDLYLRMLKQAPPVLCREVLYLYVDHPETDTRVNHERQADASARVAAGASR